MLMMMMMMRVGMTMIRTDHFSGNRAIHLRRTWLISRDLSQVTDDHDDYNDGDGDGRPG